MEMMLACLAVIWAECAKGTRKSASLFWNRAALDRAVARSQ